MVRRLRYLPVRRKYLFASICSQSVEILWSIPSKALYSTISTVAGNRIALFTKVHSALPLSTRLSKYVLVQVIYPVIVVVEVINKRT